MIDIMKLKQIFNEKLAKSGSFDEAFLKAVWEAFEHGVKEGIKAGKK